MNGLLLLGGLLCVAAGCIVLFESIAAMMSVGEIVFEASSLMDLLGGGAFAWIDRIPLVWIRCALNDLVTRPAWLLVLSMGILCLLISGFRNR
ncbi:MAG: hypothetical protein RBR20_07195 [Desulfobacterales bacterium]|jgi:hypothetical protein|nr:hypothetical protein [Desulfobacteraceae bacterium]MDD3990975.1 hypothetical protein [Desulfobacteraceae bacterium]MDY0311896.1 hypothetical protein [Desulfobacterales bacterium]